MFKVIQAVVFTVACSFSGDVMAETASVNHGGDTFIASAQLNEVVESRGDTFLAGRTIEARGATSGDLHVSGLNVSISTATAEDLYAAGATVVIRSPVAHDLTAFGFSLRTEKESVTQGNVRLFGNSVTVNGPIEGALMAAGLDVIVNAPIKGDARIQAQTLSFGPEAQISGTLTYSTKDQITVPERVAPSERVVFEAHSGMRAWEDWEDFGKEMPVLPTFASLMFGFVISLLFFLVLGALMLGFMPKRLANLRRSIAAAPGQTILLGVVGLSMLFGMVPIIAMTVVGILFVPIVLLAIVVVWTFGYALGTYGVAMRLWFGFGGAQDPSSIVRLLVFTAALVLVALLNFIPFVGWVANYTLVLLGVGAMTRAVFQRMIGSPDVTFNVDMEPIKD